METDTTTQKALPPSQEVAQEIAKEESLLTEVDRREETGYEVAQLWNKIDGDFLIVVVKIDYVDGVREVGQKMSLPVKAEAERRAQEAREVFNHPFYYAEEAGKGEQVDIFVHRAA